MAPLSQHEDNMQQSEDTHNTPASSSSSWVSITVRPCRMTFQVAAVHLPTELLLRVLQEWLGRQRIVVGGSGHSDYTLSYVNPENIDRFAALSKTNDIPASILSEHFRLRIYSWLTDTKEFDDPATFYLSHFLMILNMGDNRLGAYPNLPDQPWHTMLQDPNLTLSITFPILTDPKMQNAFFPHLTFNRGFEKIRLDFTAEQYFALFDVSVPPFHYADTTHRGDNLYSDTFCHGAGLFLAHTKELELHFGDAYKYTNPWYNLGEHAWCKTNEKWDYKEARLRPRICESGVVVDWVLTYGWYSGWLQGIKKISLTGDVQQWVKEKWYDIFNRHGEYINAHPCEMVDIFAVFTPDPIEMETIGMVDDDDNGDDDDDEAWMPQNHYPPKCACEIGCWRLRGGKVEDELEAKSWDGLEQYETEVVGDWMVGVDLRAVV